MMVEIHTTGPGMDDRRTLAPGQPEIVLGRGAECDICLPDPRRNVSRRHLSVWCEGSELSFRVLSTVNGVELPFGEAPPGACGVLVAGDILRLGEYELIGTFSSPVATEDPWAVLHRESTLPGSSLMQAEATLPAMTPVDLVRTARQEDPFGDWGFESTFGPGSRAGMLEADGAMATDFSAFFQGLGLDPQKVGPLSPGEMEDIGRLVRMAMAGLLDLYATTAELKRELRAEDRTMVASRDDNPLKNDWPLDVRLQYLLGGRGSTPGFRGPDKALAELLAELRAHEQAMGVAARAVVEGTLRDLSPAALKLALRGESPLLFESTRLWDSYERYHAEQGGEPGKWSQRLLDKYFTEAYVREALRLKSVAAADASQGP